jgi:2-keto-4-pentenoate hydratase/2-oxohepta-3-ene-1,7-dioic acid hydratase in catechol pathway
MKLVTFIIKESGVKTIGAYTENGYVDLHAQSNGTIPNDMIEFIEAGDVAMALAIGLLTNPAPQHVYEESQIILQAPIPKPGKIIHTSCNFSAHLTELAGWKAPEWRDHGWENFHFEHPTGFLQASSCIVPSGESIEIPRFTKQLDFEIEVAIIIGKTAKCVSVEEAMDYVVGLAVFNDISARDIQAREHANKVILMGKSFDGSCPLGPWLVTKDEIEDVNNLDMKLYLNDDVRQHSNTSETHYNIAQLVSWWSEMTLEPGDIITTGSPPGVISGMENPEWLKPGDVIEAHVKDLGCLVTHIGG